MQWLRWHVEQHRAVIMTAAIIVTTFVGVFVLHPEQARPGKDNNGFGPDWECTAHPLVGRICIKKMGP
jgi:hypothetical protein